MAKASDSPKMFRATTDLSMPSGFPMAHTAGSVFSSSDAQVEELGWKDGVEAVKTDDVPASAAPVTPTAGGDRSA
jgi:hypothetical protein